MAQAAKAPPYCKRGPHDFDYAKGAGGRSFSATLDVVRCTFVHEDGTSSAYRTFIGEEHTMAKPSFTRRIVVAAGILLALFVLTAIILQLFIGSS